MLSQRFKQIKFTVMCYYIWKYPMKHKLVQHLFALLQLSNKIVKWLGQEKRPVLIK